MKKKKIEEIREFAYLRYSLKRNGQKAPVQIMVRAAVVMHHVWKIRKRKFGRNYKKTVWPFDRLV